MTTQDKIKEVEKEIEDLKRQIENCESADYNHSAWDITLEMKKVELKTLKSCSEEISFLQDAQVVQEHIIKERDEKITKLQEKADKWAYDYLNLRKEQKAKVEKLKEHYCLDWVDGECNFITGCKECNRIDKIFSPEEENHKPEKNCALGNASDNFNSGSPSGEVCECGHNKDFHYGSEGMDGCQGNEDTCNCMGFLPKKAEVKGK